MTPREEGRKWVREAKATGKTYASEQLESEVFSTWVWEQLRDVKECPDKKEAVRWAKNMLTDLWNDMRRDISWPPGVPKWSGYSDDYVRDYHGVSRQEVVDAFWDGVESVIGAKNAANWLADEILFQCREP